MENVDLSGLIEKHTDYGKKIKVCGRMGEEETSSSVGCVLFLFSLLHFLSSPTLPFSHFELDQLQEILQLINLNSTEASHSLIPPPPPPPLPEP